MPTPHPNAAPDPPPPESGAPRGASGAGPGPNPAEYVRLCWLGGVPDARTLVEGWLASSGGEGQVADVLAADAEMRASRGVDARIETYAREWPGVLERPEACRGVMMAEFARLEGAGLEAAVSRVSGAAPGLAAEARGIAVLCEVMGAGEEAREGLELGKYRLVSRLGAGAFGSVWLASDGELGRYVALKLLHQSAEGAGVRRVMAEAQAAAALDHPNVVRIHAAGRLEDGRAFIDAQLVGDARPTEADPRRVEVGTPLDRAGGGTGGPRPARWAAGMIEAVARGVAAAHARGVVHRDIKPANIIVTPSGVPMLADFGLSALSGISGRSEGAAGAGRVTGTPAFMAPEQARGERATPASDIYALGATLRYLLTGELPVSPSGRHSAQGRADVLEQLRRGGVAPLEAPGSGIPRTLARICDRAMAADPGARYASAELLAEDLRAWLNHRATAAGRETAWARAGLWYRRHWATATLALAAALVLGVSSERFIARIRLERDRAVEAEAVAARRRVEAEQARDAAEGVNKFMQEALVGAQADIYGKSETLYDAIRRAHDSMPFIVGDRPIVEAGARHVIGRVFATMGEFRLAEENLRRSAELRASLLGKNAIETLYSEFALAEMLAFAERTAEAAVLAEPLPERIAALEGRGSMLARSSRALLAHIRMAQGRYDEAGAIAEELIASAEPGPETGKMHRTLGKLAKDRGRREEAVAHFEAALKVAERRLGAPGIELIGTRNDLGSVLAEMGAIDRAEPLLREAYGWFAKELGAGHVSTLNCGYNLAWMLLVKKKSAAESLAIAGPLAEAAEGVLPKENPVCVRTRLLEARGLAATGEYGKAERILVEVIPRVESLGPEGLVSEVIACRVLANCLRKLGRESEAAEWQARGDAKAKEAQQAR